VLDFTPRVSYTAYISPDSLRRKLEYQFRKHPASRGLVTLGDIRYEFTLLDPHLPESGNTAFPSPDSMDAATRALQEEFINLVNSCSASGAWYDLPNQLLSVLFREKWTVDLATMQMTKKVFEITPVIWQRRKTQEGEPINDGDTGLPVYYKNELPPIRLRNR
jgi:hypothetical protein